MFRRASMLRRNKLALTLRGSSRICVASRSRDIVPTTNEAIAMSTDDNVSQVQKMFTDWQGTASEQIGKVVDFWSELGRGIGTPIGMSLDGTKMVRESVEQLLQITKKSLEHGQTMAAEMLKLSRESLSHASELASEMHRMQLGAIKRSAEAFVKPSASN